MHTETAGTMNCHDNKSTDLTLYSTSLSTPGIFPLQLSFVAVLSLSLCFLSSTSHLECSESNAAIVV